MSLGLSFAPTKHFDLFNTITDINKFVRHLVVKKHFLNVEKNHVEEQQTTLCNVEVTAGGGLNESILDTHVPFLDEVAVSVLQDLRAESAQYEEIERSAFVCGNVDFYPINVDNYRLSRSISGSG